MRAFTAAERTEVEHVLSRAQQPLRLQSVAVRTWCVHTRTHLPADTVKRVLDRLREEGRLEVRGPQDRPRYRLNR